LWEEAVGDDDEMLCRRLPRLRTMTGIASVTSVSQNMQQHLKREGNTFIPAIEGDGGRLTSLAPARRLMAATKTEQERPEAMCRIRMQIGCLPRIAEEKDSQAGKCLVHTQIRAPQKFISRVPTTPHFGPSMYLMAASELDAY